MASEKAEKFFPHENIRAGQKELVSDLEEAFSQQKILLAHAPTGLGKTASALSIALAFALEKDKKVFFLTNRHTQHKLAVDTLKGIKKKSGEEFSCADLIGKRWMCSQTIAGLFGNEFNEFCKTVVEKGECEFYNKVRSKKDLTVEAKALIQDLKKNGPFHNEEIIALSKGKEMCSYEVSLALAKEARVIIGDYNYLFNPFVQQNLLHKLEKKLQDIILIVDEGHNLPSRVTEMLSESLTNNMIKNAILEARKFGYQGIIMWLNEIHRIMQNLADFLAQDEKERLVSKEDFLDRLSQKVEIETLIEELNTAADEIRKKQRRTYLGGIASFISSWQGEDKGYTRIISELPGKYGQVIMLSYSCLDPSMVTKEVFQNVYAGVVMSGTLKPLPMFKDILGIEKVTEKEYSSPFPSENRISLVIPETSTKYNQRSAEMFQKIALKSSELVNLIPGNVALFFPSYHLRDEVSNFIRTFKKLLWEKPEMNKEEKDALLAEFKNEKDHGAVLLGVNGANFAEGVDFPGDLLQGVVVVGLPLAHPDLKTKETIKYYDEKFGRGWDYGYTFPAVSKCLQSAGRCIRSETDRGAIIYLDERFAWPNYFNCLPREGLIVTKDYQKYLKKFFGEAKK